MCCEDDHDPDHESAWFSFDREKLPTKKAEKNKKIRLRIHRIAGLLFPRAVLRACIAVGFQRNHFVFRRLYEKVLASVDTKDFVDFLQLDKVEGFNL